MAATSISNDENDEQVQPEGQTDRELRPCVRRVASTNDVTNNLTRKLAGK